MNNKIDLNLKMYYGTEKHSHAISWLVPAKTIYNTQTNEIENIKEIDLFIISFDDCDLSNTYISYFLDKHLNNNSKVNIWAHNRYLKYRGNEFFSLFSDLSKIDNYFSIKDIREMIKDINKTIKCLIDNKENEDTIEIFKLTKSEYIDLKDINPVKDSIISFLYKFIDRLNFMIDLLIEKDLDLIEWLYA